MLAFIYIYASNFNRKMTFNPSKVILLVCSINILLPAGLREAQTTGIKFTHRPKIRFLAPQGRLVVPIHVKFGMADGHVGPRGCGKFHLNRCRRESGPQNIKDFNFLVKNRPVWANPLTDF